MMTDPIADLLTRMRNAIGMQHEQCQVSHSKMKEAILKILRQDGFISGFEVLGEKIKKTLIIRLKYDRLGTSAIGHLKRVSNPSRRVYRGYEDLPAIRNGLGVRVLTTSKGIISDAQAKKQKLGGEILVEVW